jgi:hypothetical protein
VNGKALKTVHAFRENEAVDPALLATIKTVMMSLNYSQREID